MKGDIIRILRERLGWSQQQLADEIGLSRSMISMFEIDKRVPSAETYEQMADIFNVDLDYLMGRTTRTTVLPERIAYENENYYLAADVRDIAQAVSKNPEMRMLFDAARDVSAEDLHSILEILKSLKKKEKGHE